jgi:hypothetical protein
VSLDEIQRNFSFQHGPTDYRTNLVSRVLAAFFRMDVFYRVQKQTRIQGERKWAYETNPMYRLLSWYCGQHMRDVPVGLKEMEMPAVE